MTTNWHKKPDPFEVVVEALAELRDQMTEELDRIDRSVAETRESRNGGAKHDVER